MATFQIDDLIVSDDNDRYVTLQHGDTVVSIKASINETGDMLLVVHAKRGKERDAAIGVVAGYGDVKTLPVTSLTSAGQNAAEEVTLTVGEQVGYFPTGAPNEYAVYVDGERLGVADIPHPNRRADVLSALKENA